MQNRRMISKARALLILPCAAGLPQIPGCACGSLRALLILRGKLVDADTFGAANDAMISARTLTDGELTGSGTTTAIFGEQGNLAPAEDGSFEVRITSEDQGHFCTGPLAPPANFPEFPPPNQVEVIVVRDGCRQAFLIDINEDTVVDLDFPDDVIELKDPILVAPCEE